MKFQTHDCVHHVSGNWYKTRLHVHKHQWKVSFITKVCAVQNNNSYILKLWRWKNNNSTL